MKTARNLLVSTLLLVLTAISLLHAKQPDTGAYADKCATSAYIVTHSGASDRFTCAFVRVSLGRFSTPSSEIPSGYVMLGMLGLPIMTVGAGLGARRQYGKE